MKVYLDRFVFGFWIEPMQKDKYKSISEEVGKCRQQGRVEEIGKHVQCPIAADQDDILKVTEEKNVTKENKTAESTIDMKEGQVFIHTSIISAICSSRP